VKKSSLIYLLVLILFVSCYDIEKPEKPKDLISEDQMVDVLVEISIMSSAKGINKRMLENNGITPVSYIYKKHGIDSAQFANSNNYYAHDIKVYDKIYDKVKDSLTTLRDKYKELQKEEIKKKDDKKKELRAKEELLKQDKPKINRDSILKNLNSGQK
ncbi:MAG: DUF4296 domain-containing protein, partial [Flavobacteriaceae bacterium]|nr:DUF4296 domain-containing protein [Flavobacteriaceae bacterium]